METILYFLLTLLLLLYIFYWRQQMTLVDSYEVVAASHWKVGW